MKKFSLLLFSLLFLSLKMSMADQSSNTKFPVNVGVVLDMDKYIAKMGLSCITMALSDFYDSHDYYRTRIVLHTRDSKDDVLAAAAAAEDLLENVDIQAIIGPVTSMQAHSMIDLGTKFQVPIISYSATSPSLSSIHSPYFVRIAQNDLSQVKPISAMVQYFGWRKVILIYVDNAFGEGIVPSLTDALEDIDTRILYRSVIPALATDGQIMAEAYKLSTMQTRIFIVHIPSLLGSRFFPIVKDIGMMSEGYVWILTGAVTNMLSSLDWSVIDSMQGVLGVRPYVPRTKQLDNFTASWKTKFRPLNPSTLNVELDVFGLWAYDAAISLAMAIERAGIADSNFQKANDSGNSKDHKTSGVSQMGPQLLQALLNTTFTGLSGDFRIVDGELQSSVYQMVNIIGNGHKVVSFWTPENGLIRDLNFLTSTAYNTSKANVGTILWPGDITTPPKGWVMPTNGKKLKVGVLVKDGFKEFVQVTRDPKTNTTVVKGYSIDVFDAVMASLPYAVPYEYIPYATSDGKSAGTYDDLLHQVYLGNFDVVVGDTTIVAYRSQYVDFTLPYTEAGVSMIVPTTKNIGNNAWVFLKPLTWDIWLTTFCSFIGIGFAVWIFEHRINEDFNGPPSHQKQMMLWFSFSTMVFAHKETITSNLSRIVLIIWCFAVLILTQSYTASLTSMLTVKQTQATVTNINELIKNGEHIGYQKDSFIVGFLKQKKIDDRQLVMYGSPEELDELFSNYSIAVALDEIPYMKLFLSKYCSKYTMVAPTYKTDGFGFAFPIGSPLVSDVSRRILNVTEGDKIIEIEKTWFGQTNCPDSGTSFSSNSLSVESFRGLFLFVGVTIVLSLAIFTYTFVSENRHILRKLAPVPLYGER